MCDLTPDLSVTLWSSTRSPAIARDFVGRHVCPEHGTAATGALLLATSELVTNAVLHGRAPVTVDLSCGTSEVRLVVRDTGSTLPGSSGAPGGVGLAIVEKIVRDWGVTPLERGKEIWCRLPTGHVPSRPLPAQRSGSDAPLLHPA